MHSTGFEPSIPEIEKPQTYVLYRTAAGIGHFSTFFLQRTVPGKVTTARTDDGHKWNTKTGATISTKRTKEHRTTEEEMEGPTSH